MRSEQGPLLFLLAHPDDEFGVFPWIERALAQGRDIHCAWMTDGGWGGQDVLRRQRESEQALLRMGVPIEAMCFLGGEHGFADGDLWNQLDPAIEALQSRYASVVPTEVIVPAWEGGHPDHDASHLIGIAFAAKVGADVLQYTLYQGRGLPGPAFRVLSPMPANGPCIPVSVSVGQRLRYIIACLGFRSQWKSFVGLLPFYALKLLFTRHPFVLQPVKPERTADKPHAGLMLYERRGGPSWETFAERTAPYRHR
ncbi:PIG-L family deacetylase [Stenotrophomonas sp.]|uniref:PIG-L deacetylase family protein n=1 Tax=Stenotrophomonas sp. TaxID=69392 RepID=UPI00289D9D48|nr:PIG-L family deacetylase [Stenotrophomonas sp.]